MTLFSKACHLLAARVEVDGVAAQYGDPGIAGARGFREDPAAGLEELFARLAAR